MQLVSKISNLCDHNPPTSQTDGRTTCDRKTALCPKVHCAVKKISLHCRTPETLITSPSTHTSIIITARCYNHRARYCHGKLSYVSLSVRPSVRLSATLKYRGHIGWNSAKVISQPICLTFSLSADPNMTYILQREHPKF